MSGGIQPLAEGLQPVPCVLGIPRGILGQAVQQGPDLIEICRDLCRSISTGVLPLRGKGFLHFLPDIACVTYLILGDVLLKKSFKLFQLLLLISYLTDISN